MNILNLKRFLNEKIYAIDSKFGKLQNFVSSIKLKPLKFSQNTFEIVHFNRKNENLQLSSFNLNNSVVLNGQLCSELAIPEMANNETTATSENMMHKRVFGCTSYTPQKLFEKHIDANESSQVTHGSIVTTGLTETNSSSTTPLTNFDLVDTFASTNGTYFTNNITNNDPLMSMNDIFSSSTCQMKNMNIKYDSIIFANHLSILKLPKFQLPTFDGNVRKWNYFHDMFKKMIHDKEQLDPIEKFTYLKNCLQSEALSLVSNLDISAANYEHAWNLLIKRYKNKRSMIEIEILHLIDLSSKDIKTLHDRIVEVCHNLKALDVNIDTWDEILVPLVLKKLDQDTILAFEDTLADSKVMPKLIELLNFMEKRFQILDHKQFMTTSNKPKKSYKNYSLNSANLNEKECLKCGENHFIGSCSSFLELSQEERYDFVKSKNLCVNCISHKYSRDCTSKFRCKECNKFHHSLLHNFDNDDDESDNLKTNHSLISNGSILPTALVYVTGQSDMKIQLRALIDNGSQASFISQKGSNLINAKMKRHRSLIHGVSLTTCESKFIAEATLLSLLDKNFKLTSNFIVLQELTKLSYNEDNEIFPEWTNEAPFPLADHRDMFNPNSIDMIIGADLLTHIMLPGLMKSENNFLAQNTVFGWTLLHSGRRSGVLNSNQQIGDNDD